MPGGLQCYCRHCASDYAGEYYTKHQERIKAFYKSRREKNPEKVRLEIRRSELKCKYGLTLADYDALRQRQENRCGSCGDEFKPGLNRVSVDHCHKTGVVRGLLCNNCNLGIGRFKDSPRRLRLAAQYMDRFEYLSVLF